MHSKSDMMGNWKPGFDALLDLQYAYYFPRKESSKAAHGILTGISAGYSQSPISAAIDTTYMSKDNKIQYTVKADQLSQSDGQIQIEIPVMYSLLMDNGFFFNIGPKFMMPVFTHYTETATNADIDAYFPEVNVHVRNQDATGNLEDKTATGSWGKNKLKINVMLGADLGYEWKLKSGNALGLGVYAHYSLYNSFKNDAAGENLINVTEPTSSNPASVGLLSATDNYVKGMNYFDGGLKLIYHFNFPKQYK